MSYVTTVPEALNFAARELETLGVAMAAENAAIATPTAGVVPAAADQVSALQATIFASYAALHQTVAAQAQSVHEQCVATLRSSAASYSTAEAVNQASTSMTGASSINPIEWLATVLGGPNPSLNGEPFSLSGNLVNILHESMTYFVADAGGLLSLTGGGLVSAPATGAAVASGDAAVAATSHGPARTSTLLGAVGTGATKAAGVSAALGQSAPVGRLSVPASWGTAASTTAATGDPAARLPGAPAETTAATTVPMGMPAVAGGGRATGYGAPRYGAKPTVFENPTAG